MRGERELSSSLIPAGSQKLSCAQFVGRDWSNVVGVTGSAFKSKEFAPGD